MRTNNVVVLFLAIVMGGIAAMLARSWLQSHARASLGDEGIGTIVVAAQPLSFGTNLSTDNVTEIPWASRSLPDGAFASKDELFKYGTRAVLAALDRNEPVLKSKITGPGQRGSLSAILEEGKRAVTVRVDDVRGVAGFIQPGDFVDVVLIGEDPGAQREGYSDILLHHVKVLAIDQLAAERPEQPTIPKAVTLEVTTEQAQKILLASNIGKLSLILRQPGDGNTDGDKRVTERDIGRNPPRPPVLPMRVPPPPPPPPPKPVVIAPPPPPPPPPTVTVTIIRGTKQHEDYQVKREESQKHVER
ncbi:MAG TPA: Flp pilus assembly protein CpaB [Xanthobacteraceae bacterium]|jgi:pilus assembly protein CpaB